MTGFCSIVSSTMAAQARVMAESVRRHHPDARLLLAATDLEIDGSEEVPQTAGSSIPVLLRHALAESEVAVYLDPQVCLYAPLDPLLAAASADGVALVARVSSLPDDDERPDPAALLDAGEISPAVLAVARGASADTFLDWWARRIAESDVSDGRRLALAHEQLGFSTLVSDPGCCVSYWNLHERPLDRGNGGVTAAGAPLRAMHFAGFRPDRPYWLSDEATRVHVIDDPILSELCGEYGQQVLAAGWMPPRRQLGALTRLGNGQRVDHLVRALWEEAKDAGKDFGDPLTPTAAETFVAWMREPAERGGGEGVTRYLYTGYLTRPDLQQAFPDLDMGDGKRLLDWAASSGRQDVLAGLVSVERESGGVGSALGINVIGYLGETLGLAEAARLYIAALTAAGVPVTTTAISPDLPIEDSQRTITRYGSHGYEDRRAAVEPTFNLACLNGDHLAELVQRRGPDVLGGLPTIGQWGWETDVLPPSWTPAFDLVDEVWVYSRFMAENLGRLLPMPVVVVPPAIVAPDPAGAKLPVAWDDRFTFVFMLDFFSTLERKNPLGLVDAFTRAFSPGEGPRLLIKTINGRFRPAAVDELRHRVGDRPDVEFFDEYLDPSQKAALLQRADCYVSLHRSEGFGLPLAEAMSLGTPVIATGYSGNTDFTTPFNSYLVDWRPTRVGPDVEIYPPDGHWAEPELDHAAELMRYVWQHPDEAAARGARARADIELLYAPAVSGAVARARLNALMDARAAGGGHRGPAAGDALTKVQHALASFDLRNGQPPAPAGLSGLVRRCVLRLLVPFTYHEREIDHGLLQAIADLRSQVGAVHDQAQRARTRLRRLEQRLEHLNGNGRSS